MIQFEDVLETILEEYARRDSEGEFDTWEETDAFVKEKAEVLLAYVKEEPVSEDLEEAAKEHAVERFRTTRDEFLAEKCKWSFKAGAQWQKNLLPKWKKTPTGGCWSGEIGVNPTKRMFTYEHYSINADKLFELLDKE